jgi:hypothetical protein
VSYVSQPSAPIHDMGWALPRVRARSVQTVRQPAYPLYDGGAFYDGLHGLGVNAPAIVGAGAPIIAKATTGILTATGTFGSFAGPVGAGIGVLVGVIAGLWAAHNARVKGAKAENQAINSAVQTFGAGLKAIFAAANSSDPTQNVSAADAAQQVQQLWSTFWAQMSPYMHSPGTADTSGGGVNCGSGLNPAGPCQGTPGGHKCDKSCTATCCVGCQDLFPTYLQAMQVFQSGGGTVQACTVYGSSYGAQQRSGYTLTYTPPTLQSTVSSVASSVESSLSNLFGGSPSTPGSSSSFSLLPLLAIGAVAFLALR